MIELIRGERIEEALAFAQSHLSESGETDPSVLGELERTLALLAFEDPASSPFGDLLKPAHRNKVTLCFIQPRIVLFYDIFHYNFRRFKNRVRIDIT